MFDCPAEFQKGQRSIHWISRGEGPQEISIKARWCPRTLSGGPQERQLWSVVSNDAPKLSLLRSFERWRRRYLQRSRVDGAARRQGATEVSELWPPGVRRRDLEVQDINNRGHSGPAIIQFKPFTSLPIDHRWNAFCCSSYWLRATNTLTKISIPRDIFQVNLHDCIKLRYGYLTTTHSTLKGPSDTLWIGREQIDIFVCRSLHNEYPVS